jgi:hypothetical protein
MLRQRRFVSEGGNGTLTESFAWAGSPIFGLDGSGDVYVDSSDPAYPAMFAAEVQPGLFI